MVSLKAVPAFDFDEWANLYQRDPVAFEARRKALLTLEVVRTERHFEWARDLIKQLEPRLDGQSDAERLRISMQEMLSSANRLACELQSLCGALHSGQRSGCEHASRPN